jgi:ubiquitin C-terminal hydrolase
MNMQSLMDMCKVKSNDTLYVNDRQVKGKDVQFEVVWHPSVNSHLFDALAAADQWKQVNEFEAPRKGVELIDCLKEFRVTETLDDDNKWYCSNCKDHVQANKTLEVYRTPPILVITLKRFKTGKSKYGFGVGGSKLDTHVNFPLEGLNLSDFILCGE